MIKKWECRIWSDVISITTARWNQLNDCWITVCYRIIDFKCQPHHSLWHGVWIFHFNPGWWFAVSHVSGTFLHRLRPCAFFFFFLHTCEKVTGRVMNKVLELQRGAKGRVGGVNCQDVWCCVMLAARQGQAEGWRWRGRIMVERVRCFVCISGGCFTWLRDWFAQKQLWLWQSTMGKVRLDFLDGWDIDSTGVQPEANYNIEGSVCLCVCVFMRVCVRAYCV